MRDDVPTARSVSRTQAAAARALLVIDGADIRHHALPIEGDVTVGRGSTCAICIDHPTLSRVHLTLQIGQGVHVIDHGGTNGTSLRGARLPPEVPVEVGAYETIHAGDLALVVQVVPEVGGAGRVAPDASGEIVLATDPVPSPALKGVYEVAARVARGTIGVLVVGETGAGKEVLAEHIHRSSPRSAGPLVRVNCAALSEQLIESELFGHDRGAFTGAARDRAGLVEAAHGGTLLLDEVGELSPGVQAKLLRVLEDRRVMRVGSTVEREVDVRFVAATNRDLQRDVEAGKFRRDLYFRIAGVVLFVPPLRERRAEIEPLARAFLADAAKRLGAPPPPITIAALAALEAHAWPGNVRELKATIERAVLIATGPIGVADLALDQETRAPDKPAVVEAQLFSQTELPQELADLEYQRIVDALEQTGGNQTRAAELLGMPRRTLVKRIAKHGIKRPRAR